MENKQLHRACWGFLVVGLSIGTFGIWWTLFIFIYILLFAVGFLLVMGYWGYILSLETAKKCQEGDFGPTSKGLEKVIQEIQLSRNSFKMDKRLTGSSIIDEPLQEVLQLFFRDYVHGWYYTISTDEGFLYDLRQALQRALIAFANRSKDVEWVNFLTTRFVDDITNHLKIYRKAKERLDKNEGDDNATLDVETAFFQVEHEMEKDICREQICLSEGKEKDYLSDISEVLLYLLLPPEDFHNKPFRYFFREMIATCVLFPMVSMICDADYINQTIAWLCEDSSFTREAFMTMIREGLTAVEDVEVTKDKVDLEIAKLRAHDSETSGAADVAVRQQLSSLIFVKNICEAKIRTLKYGDCELPSIPSEQADDLGKLIPPNKPLPTLPLQVILDNNIALSYFIEFMNSAGGQAYLYFWLAVESYRVTAEQQLSLTLERQLIEGGDGSGNNEEVDHAIFADVEAMRLSAQSIFDQYLSETADPRVVLPKELPKKIFKRIAQEEPSPNCFDDVQAQVYDIIHGDSFYGTFLKSRAYIRCLLDLEVPLEKSDDLETASNVEDDDAASIDSEFSAAEDNPFRNKLWSPDDDIRLNAAITEIGSCKENGKAYALYSINVYRASSEGTKSWAVFRRYSDFDDLHMHLKEKFGQISFLLLPGKRTFHNLDKKFLEKRRIALDSYLQNLLSTEILAQHPGMFEIVSNFLIPGAYAREKGQFARKVDTLVAPIRQVSHAIKTVPDSLSGGVQKIFTKPGGQRRDLKEDSRHLYADIDPEEDDNIPLRILLLLMDEIFDLKHRNLWLRRRIIVLLRQIIKTTYGDTINRKIVDYVNYMTSAEQIAEYVKLFRDSFWPGGVLAESSPERKKDVKVRTRVAAKTKMFGSIPEELKRFLGSEVTMEGVCRVFDTFQYCSLNKRLLYVLWEGILELLFPDNKFNDIFLKIHAKPNT
ncbi:sorting nexin-13-like isoform X2 [Montipora foliosa]|uniref:sorting nexin-13-like isoform X2 n=1 Tax=Montipora foliosa TaxID=591990 RepID=UPI0035F134E2